MNSGYKKEPETQRGLYPLQSHTAELGRSLQKAGVVVGRQGSMLVKGA